MIMIDDYGRQPKGRESRPSLLPGLILEL